VSLDLICCSLEAWDEVWRRNQYLVRELLAAEPACRVLFVEPPHDPLHQLVTRRSPRPGREALRQVHERVWAFQPRKVLPRVFGAFADNSLARQVERRAQRVGFTAPVLWVNDAAYVTLMRRNRWPTLYDITDDWLAAEATAREHRRRVAREDALMRDADEVVVCSPALAARRGGTRSVRLIPNGVDLDAYAEPSPRPPDLPPPPTAVYAGTLHRDRLDAALVVESARAHADTNFVFVGPIALAGDDVRRLEAEPNVVLLGARAASTVPAYLTHATALIVPHVRNAFTDSLDPLKAYEYLAAARPVVSTDVAGFRDLEHPQVTAVPSDRFVAALRIALRDDRTFPSPPLPTWRERGGAFLEALRAAAHAGRKNQLNT
jgi:glycosyltransferase involved in cell wall biosynthesis